MKRKNVITVIVIAVLSLLLFGCALTAGESNLQYVPPLPTPETSTLIAKANEKCTLSANQFAQMVVDAGRTYGEENITAFSNICVDVLTKWIEQYGWPQKSYKRTSDAYHLATTITEQLVAMGIGPQTKQGEYDLTNKITNNIGDGRLELEHGLFITPVP